MRNLAIGLLLTSACAFGSSLAYVATPSDEFGTMNLSTGAFTEIATEPDTLIGLAWGSNGLLYAMDKDGNVVTIDPVTGAETVVGASGLGATTNLFAGLTGGGLYALDGSNNLYSINPVTAVATLIGATSVPAIDPTDFSDGAYADSLMADGSQLYVTEIVFGSTVVPETLYTVNPSNGSTTTAGSLPTDYFIGSGFIDGSYYLFGGGNPILTLDPTTAATSFVANGSVLVYGAVGVPDPATLALVLAGLAAFFALRSSSSWGHRDAAFASRKRIPTS